MKKLAFVLCLSFGAVSGAFAQGGAAGDPWLIHRCIKEVTDVMVRDIFSPPVASRIYAYVTIAGYEAARQADTSFPSLAGRLHELKTAPAPEVGKKYDFSVSSAVALLTVGRAMVISEETIQEYQAKVLEQVKAGLGPEVFANSVAYGKLVAAHILAWAAKDKYKETRAMAKYDPGYEDWQWKPTPPSYMKAIEPHWSEMRTFVIDSARQFVPHPPTAFSAEKGSPFYADAMEVYEVGQKLTEEQRVIANFWDCNPFKMNVHGHLMFATKKISPGGHWINITATVCEKANAGVIKSLQAYAWTSVVIADAFISCWDEKYRSKAIRPETYINQYISADWMPLLQTPPFPEYTSGHSVVSASAAVVLTRLFGDRFAFTDSTEVEFGLVPRTFVSFDAAAQEAAISRFYGGIHFKPAIEYGLDEGRRIGEFVAGRMQ